MVRLIFPSLKRSKASSVVYSSFSLLQYKEETQRQSRSISWRRSNRYISYFPKSANYQDSASEKGTVEGLNSNETGRQQHDTRKGGKVWLINNDSSWLFFASVLGVSATGASLLYQSLAQNRIPRHSKMHSASNSGGGESKDIDAQPGEGKLRIFQTPIATSPNVGKMYRPTIFGHSILALEEESDNSEKNQENLENLAKGIDNREDCPICRKYSKVGHFCCIQQFIVHEQYATGTLNFLLLADRCSPFQGPCGKLFHNWLTCTDEFDGQVDAITGEDMHLSKCSHLATPLAECLETKQAHYQASSSMDNNTNEILAKTWKGIVQDLEQERDKKTKPFPSRRMMPRMEINPSGSAGLAVFAPIFQKDASRGLIFAYVKDNNGKVVAAATASDMEDQQDLFDGFALSYDIDRGVESVTAFVVYDGHSDALPPIYAKKSFLK
jgi:hypothetical protein